VEKSAESEEKSAESEKKSAESVEKSAESVKKSADSEEKISKRHEKILSVMDKDTEYGADEIAMLVGLKSARTRQILKELISLGKIKAIGVTKGRRYMKL
jgi:predicted HTH transcriptional regulator